MRKTGYELVEELDALSSFEDKAKFLKKNEAFFRPLCYYAFHDAAEFSFKKLPAYKPSKYPAGAGFTDLTTEMKLRRLDKFLRISGMKQRRKEQLLTSTLESMETKEAQLLCSVIEKKLRFKDVSYPQLQGVFPDLLP